MYIYQQIDKNESSTTAHNENTDNTTCTYMNIEHIRYNSENYRINHIKDDYI